MGLTQESVVWAFTAFHSGNWHPFTWLSHMLDCQLFGLKPGMHHLTNLLLHITNTLLLFLLLQRMTGKLWQSAFLAALFGLHPLHSESVAWVSERKDVLSTFFWMLTVGFYLRYVERPGLSRYLLVLLFFALGLMAKPMLVTLPFVLLLIDYWPLGRLRFSKSCKESNLHIQKSQAFRLVWEKAPFFALSAASSFVTVLAQQEGKLVESLHAVPLKMRIANALVSYESYIAKMIWPQDLAVFYPLPETIPMWKTAAAGLLLICLSIVLIRAWRRFPYLGVGWLWYLGTLVPVIGLVHVGGQAMANRYTYIPFVGLFMLIAWGLPDLLGRWHYRTIALGILGVVVLAVLMECTRLQLRHWENSVALWKHTANVTDNNYSAHSMLAAALVERGRFEEAIASASTSLKIKHDFAEACNNLGLALCKQGKLDEGIVSFAKAIQIKPGYAKAHNNLGSALARQGNLNKAVVHFSEALRIDPNLANAQIGIASALARQGRLKEAINHLSKALEIKPNNAEVHSRGAQRHGSCTSATGTSQ